MRVHETYCIYTGLKMEVGGGYSNDVQECFFIIYQRFSSGGTSS